MLEKCGTNGYGWQFWKLNVPEEHAPGGLEIDIHTEESGLRVGGGLIHWDEIDAARAAMPEAS